jgi:hypothetical protein
MNTLATVSSHPTAHLLTTLPSRDAQANFAWTMVAILAVIYVGLGSTRMLAALVANLVRIGTALVAVSFIGAVALVAYLTHLLS